MGLLAVHPSLTSSAEVQAVYDMGNPETRSYINSLLGAEGDTFDELVARLKSIPKNHLKEFMNKAAEELMQYAETMADSENEIGGIRAFTIEVNFFSQINKHDCKKALKQF